MDPTDRLLAPDRDLPASPDDMAARLDAQTRDALDVADRARVWQEEATRLRGSGSWGGVRAEVDVHGLLVDVRLERPGGGGPEHVLRAVRGAYGAALADVHARLAARAHATWGDDPLVGRIVAESGARLGLAAGAEGLR